MINLEISEQLQRLEKTMAADLAVANHRVRVLSLLCLIELGVILVLIV
jgi:hypothetical protein